MNEPEIDFECIRAVVDAMRYEGLRTAKAIREFVVSQGFSDELTRACMKYVAERMQ